MIHPRSAVKVIAINENENAITLEDTWTYLRIVLFIPQSGVEPGDLIPVERDPLTEHVTKVLWPWERMKNDG